jgi:hypothetical protein
METVMSSFSKFHQLVKASALFMLCASLTLFCLPARAADQIADINGALAQIGAGVIFWVLILLVVILVCAFHDGKSRNSRDDDSPTKRPD